MFKRIRVRLYPTIKQQKMLENHMDAYRYCYNVCLEYWNYCRMDKRNISGYEMGGELLQVRKEIPFLNSCKAECVREAAHQVDKAYKNFFKGKGYPKFKSKKNYQGFHAYQSISCKNNRIKFFGNKIKFKTSGNYGQLLENHKIKQITFKKDKVGDFWATMLIETEDIPKLPKISNSIGIDLGLKDLVITSDGTKFANNKYFVNGQYKLKRLQRKFTKTKKGGKNREKLRIKIAKHYRKQTRRKEHYYHQITNQLISENQTIIMETLSAKNMIKNKKLSKAISDASWGLFTQMLEYKCNWYGRGLIKIGRFFPSSKTCSCCGKVKEDLKLSDRIYKCDSCGTEIDRDINAAINIKKEGLKMAGQEEIKISNDLPVEDADNSRADEAGSNI